MVAGIVARLTKRKGHALLFRALSQIDGLRVVIFGEGEEEVALHELADELGISDRLVWAGHREDAAQLMQALDLFVLPSFMETMPLTILEAMAAALPVVATSIYGVPELVDDGVTGVLVPVGHEARLRRALRSLVLDPSLRQHMGAQGRHRYEQHFTAEQMAKQTASIYQKAGFA